MFSYSHLNLDIERGVAYNKGMAKVDLKGPIFWLFLGVMAFNQASQSSISPLPAS